MKKWLLCCHNNYIELLNIFKLISSTLLFNMGTTFCKFCFIEIPCENNKHREDIRRIMAFNGCIYRPQSVCIVCSSEPDSYSHYEFCCKKCDKLDQSVIPTSKETEAFYIGRWRVRIHCQTCSEENRKNK